MNLCCSQVISTTIAGNFEIWNSIPKVVEKPKSRRKEIPETLFTKIPENLKNILGTVAIPGGIGIIILGVYLEDFLVVITGILIVIAVSIECWRVRQLNPEIKTVPLVVNEESEPLNRPGKNFLRIF